MLQDSILMDTGTVCESVLSHDRLAPCNDQAAHAADQARRFDDLAGIYVRVKAFEVVRPRPHRHHDLFNRSIPSAFSNTVDGSLDLARTSLDRSDRIRHRHAEIVMA